MGGKGYSKQHGRLTLRLKDKDNVSLQTGSAFRERRIGSISCISKKEGTKGRCMKDRHCAVYLHGFTF